MSQQPGLAMVTASISQALLGNRSVSVSVPVTVMAAGPLNGLSPLSGVFSFLPVSYLPLLIFAVVLVILIFGGRRTLRKRRNALEEKDDDGESQQPPKT
jgi:membrane protein implicated in regulation of membrane protease activity